MNTKRYDLLGLAAVDSHDAPGAVADELDFRLGHFSARPEGGRAADIDLAPMAPGGMPGLAPDHLQAGRGFSLTTVDGGAAAVLPFRGRADVVLLPGDPMRIRYAPRPGVAGKLSALVQYALQCALLRREAAMFHGAALVREGQCLVLTGLQGARKTLVMLHLLREGWNFLADDRFLLQGGTAHLYSGSIPLRPHHLAALPWLETQGETMAAFAPKARRMRAVARWCERHIPSYLVPRLEKYYNAPVSARPDELFPGCKSVDAAPVSDVVMLVGDREGHRERTLQDALEDLAIILDVEFHDYLRMELEMRVRGVNIRPCTRPALETGLAGVRIHEVGVPADRTPGDTAREVLECIARA